MKTCSHDDIGVEAAAPAFPPVVPAVILLPGCFRMLLLGFACLRLLIRILPENLKQRLLLRRWWPRPRSYCFGAVLMCTPVHAGPLDSRSHRVRRPVAVAVKPRDVQAAS